jgi:alkanesulfonate monooxygenase SsuD/methylene tetrahydromethanopterin reductase-like flavin-dependent oxidoreductase (luciferase family)
MDESRARFEHGIEAVTKLWTHKSVRHADPFCRFGPITMLPRPVATRHPDRTPRKVQMSFHFHVAETDDQAIAEARGPRDQYVFDSLPQT